MEETDEMLEPDPFASPYALGRLKIFEGDLQPIHGRVVKDREINQGGQEKEIEVRVANRVPSP